MAYRAAEADEFVDDATFDWAAAEEELSATDYGRIPYIARRWLWPDFLPIGAPTIWAAAGETGKGMLFCLVAARVVLGLPFPNEHQDLRRDPRRVVWITGAGEDDQFEDLAPRLRAAIRHAVAEFGLDPELAGDCGPDCSPDCGHAIRLVHDLSEWKDGERVTLPEDCPRILTELAAIPKRHGAPSVGLVVADSYSALLSDSYTVNGRTRQYTMDSRQGARRINGKLSDFTRAADVAFAIIHHLTKDGKVAGSPAVLDSLRLAFTIERDIDDPSRRVIKRRKANISNALPQQYIITGDGPSVHAEFTQAADSRAERVAAAAGRDAASVPTVGIHERVADAAGTPSGPWRLLRQTTPRGGTARRDVLDPNVADRDTARAMAGHDAGAVLAWQMRGKVPHMSVALHTRADGTQVSYAVYPVSAGAPVHV